MTTKIKGAARELRRQLDEVREDVDSGTATTRTVSDARAIRDRALEQGRALAEAGSMRASEQREYASLEAIAVEANDLADDAKRGAVREQVVLGTLTFETDDPEARAAFVQYLRTGDAGELRAQGVSVDADGGYTVPTGFRNKLVESLKSYGGLRRVCEVLPTNDGTEMPYPTVDDTANTGSGILAENTSVADQDIAFGARRCAPTCSRPTS